MLNAISLINVERTKVQEVAEALAEMQGIAEVYSVGGRWDLVAILRVRANEDLSELVTGRMTGIQGITGTETMIGFRAYSRHDLETMFDMGER